jgi:hypothetical protein
MSNADIFALQCYAAMLPVMAAIVWAWWKDGTEMDADEQEDPDVSDSGSEPGDVRSPEGGGSSDTG